jgi:pantothenate kinase type III
MTRILAVDMGNSYTKYALVEDGVIKTNWRHPTSDVSTAADAVLAATDATVVLSSVVPVVAEQLKQLCAARGRQLVEISQASQSTVKSTSGELGADLLAAAVAARKLYAPNSNVIILGLGTAHTMTALKADGSFAGVHIDLGLTPTLEELSRRCGLIPKFAIEDVGSLTPGFNTKDSVLGGVFVSKIGGLKEWISHTRATLNGSCVVVATGGWAMTVAHHVPLDHLDKELVLKGIYFIYEDMQAKVAPPSAPDPRPVP